MERTLNKRAYAVSLKQIVVLLALLVAALSPFIFFEPAPIEFALILLFGVVAARGVHRSNLPVFWLVIAHLSLVYLAVFFAASESGAVSPYQIMYMLTQTYLSLGFIALFVSFREFPELGQKFSQVWVAAGLISSVLVLSLHFTFSPEIIYRDEFRVRLSGFFQDPNVLGPYLIFPIVYLFIHRGNPMWARLIMILPLVILLYLTFSRAAYVGALIAIGVALAVAASKDGRFFRSVLIMAGSGVIIAAFYIDDIGVRLANAEYFFARLRLQDYDSSRFAHLALGFREGAVTFFGLGPGEFAVRHGNNPHNLFIGRLTDAGWGPALITVFAFLAALWRTGRLSMKRTLDPTVLAVFSVLVAHLVMSMVIHSHHWRHLWVLIALGLTLTPSYGMITRNRRSRNQTGKSL